MKFLLEADCGIAKAGWWASQRTWGFGGGPPNRRRPVAEGEARQFLESRMPLEASNSSILQKSDSESFNFP